ncbi:hypothetical protein HOY80DRAFT_1034605 [Tuber brumale]|nr:hypothetical protein HOY80DRAFT_1034605 [Tuber brumale]
MPWIRKQAQHLQTAREQRNKWKKVELGKCLCRVPERREERQEDETKEGRRLNNEESRTEDEEEEEEEEEEYTDWEEEVDTDFNASRGAENPATDEDK